MLAEAAEVVAEEVKVVSEKVEEKVAEVCREGNGVRECHGSARGAVVERGPGPGRDSGSGGAEWRGRERSEDLATWDWRLGGETREEVSECGRRGGGRGR